MTLRPYLVLPLLIVLPCTGAAQQAPAQTGELSTAAQTRAALQQAQRQAAAADLRGQRLEIEARRATQKADRTAREAAALAARIQQAEAGIAAADARMTLISQQRSVLAEKLAQRREPLVRLTAALQKLARRPLALSALRPGSLRDTVYLRALLESTLPEVRARTAGLRAEMDRSRRLESEAQQALAALKGSEAELSQRRTQLAALETQQRLASRQASGVASREIDRALALAEQARDLDSLARQLDKAGSLSAQLAALSGPIMRPSRPEASQVAGAGLLLPTPAPSSTSPPASFQLPVVGRTITGFGAPGAGGLRASGLSLAPAAGAQVVAPAAGRVAFSGPYRGYGRIVIIVHSGGWTSLVTGLARTDVQVGQELVTGSPLGVAGSENPKITLELRRDGEPVNPLDYLR